MNPLKIFSAITAIIVSAAASNAQELSRDVRPFSRIIASPHIHLILTEGEKESVRVVHGDLNPERINIEVRGKTLRLFLDDAKVVDKIETVNRRFRRSVYEGVSVTAYITYKNLDHLEVRGTSEVTCDSPIHSERKFKLKAYGENEIIFASLSTPYFKSVMYGENKLKIKGGKSEYQKYKLYGENGIDATRMKSYAAYAISFGESDVRIFSQDEVRLTSFGESHISFMGDAYLSKGIIVGRLDINRIN
jgi:hypothetical protein